MLEPSKNKENKMSDSAVVDVLVTAIEQSQKVAKRRKLNRKQRVGEFITTIRRAMNHAGLKTKDYKLVCNKRSWRDIGKPISRGRDCQVTSLAKAASEKVGLESKTDDFVLARRAIKFSKVSVAHYVSEDQPDETICGFRVTQRDISVPMVKNNSVIQCGCTKCNKILNEADDEGRLIKICRVKNVKKKTTTTTKPLAKGMERYICQDCGQSLTTFNANRPAKCFNCKGTRIVRENTKVKHVKHTSGSLRAQEERDSWENHVKGLP